MEIVSTMGSGTIGRELDLEVFVKEIESHLGSSTNANFVSDGMVTLQLCDSGPTYTVFRTGSFQIRGAKTEGLLTDAANRFHNTLGEIGVEIKGYEFEHVTSVFMIDLNQEVDLEVLTISLGMENVEYEPEQFPGLIYRPPDYEVTLLVFSSGKMIITGTIDRKEALSATDHVEQNIVTISE